MKTSIRARTQRVLFACPNVATLALLAALALPGCQKAEPQANREKDLELKERELALREAALKQQEGEQKLADERAQLEKERAILEAAQNKIETSTESEGVIPRAVPVESVPQVTTADAQKEQLEKREETLFQREIKVANQEQRLSQKAMDLAGREAVPDIHPLPDYSQLESSPTGDYSVFYENLTPLGGWFQTPAYGLVWQPRVARSSRDWRPYSIGRWVCSNHGWTWVSEEPFGWACYHYGRWVLLANFGWAWVPGDEWAPAWVAWHQTPECIGWAPLPPETLAYRGRDWGSVDSNDFRCGTSLYVFIETRFFGSPIHHHFLPLEQNRHLFNSGHPTTQITVYNNQIATGGPSYRHVRDAVGGNLPFVSLNLDRTHRAVGNNTSLRIQGGEMNVYAPTVRAPWNAALKPAQIAGRLEDARPHAENPEVARHVSEQYRQGRANQIQEANHVVNQMGGTETLPQKRFEILTENRRVAREHPNTPASNGTNSGSLAPQTLPAAGTANPPQPESAKHTTPTGLTATPPAQPPLLNQPPSTSPAQPAIPSAPQSPTTAPPVDTASAPIIQGSAAIAPAHTTGQGAAQTGDAASKTRHRPDQRQTDGTLPHNPAGLSTQPTNTPGAAPTTATSLTEKPALPNSSPQIPAASPVVVPVAEPGKNPLTNTSGTTPIPNVRGHSGTAPHTGSQPGTPPKDPATAAQQPPVVEPAKPEVPSQHLPATAAPTTTPAVSENLPSTTNSLNPNTPSGHPHINPESPHRQPGVSPKTPDTTPVSRTTTPPPVEPPTQTPQAVKRAEAPVSGSTSAPPQQQETATQAAAQQRQAQELAAHQRQQQETAAQAAAQQRQAQEMAAQQRQQQEAAAQAAAQQRQAQELAARQRQQQEAAAQAAAQQRQAQELAAQQRQQQEAAAQAAAQQRQAQEMAAQQRQQQEAAAQAAAQQRQAQELAARQRQQQEAAAQAAAQQRQAQEMAAQQRQQQEAAAQAAAQQRQAQELAARQRQQQEAAAQAAAQQRQAQEMAAQQRQQQEAAAQAAAQQRQAQEKEAAAKKAAEEAKKK